MIDKIINSVCDITNLSFDDIKGYKRDRDLVYARFILTHHLRKYDMRVTKIGELLNKDHSTISYYIKSYYNEYESSQLFKDIANEVNMQLHK